MKTLLLYTPAAPAIEGTTTIVAERETPAEVKALLKNQDELAKLLKGKSGGFFLVVEPNKQFEIKPVTQFVCTQKEA